jgi:hypothetical protein
MTHLAQSGVDEIFGKGVEENGAIIKAHGSAPAAKSPIAIQPTQNKGRQVLIACSGKRVQECSGGDQKLCRNCTIAYGKPKQFIETIKGEE